MHPTIARSTLTGRTLTIDWSTLPRNTRIRNVRRPAPKATLAGALARLVTCAIIGAALGAMLALGA